MGGWLGGWVCVYYFAFEPYSLVRLSIRRRHSIPIWHAYIYVCVGAGSSMKVMNRTKAHGRQ